MRIRISRKKAKESAYWLRLLLETNETLNNGNEIQELFNESIELKKILFTILEKSKRKVGRIS